MPDRVLVAATKPVGAHRSPFGTDTPGVGVLAIAVIRAAIAGIDAQQIGERHALRYRHARFSEVLVHAQNAANANLWASRSGKGEVCELSVGLQDEPLLAPLCTQHESKSVLGGRHLQTIFAEVGLRRSAHLAQCRTSRLQGGRMEIVDRSLSDAADPPDVVRHAGRISS